MSGKLITLEGLDGSGKATQAELLCRLLLRPVCHFQYCVSDVQTSPERMEYLYRMGAGL